MEEKSVEIPKIQGPLREQDSIRALLELLEQQGMEQEKGDVIRMADHIDSMEMQLGTVLKELGEMKKQLCSLLCQSSAGSGSGKGTGKAGRTAEETKETE